MVAEKTEGTVRPLRGEARRELLRVWAGPGRWACAVGVLVAAGLSVVLTWVLPRPFYVLSNDYDNGHYYNIRAHHMGMPIHNVEHPGTPVIVLGSLVMTARTERLDETQGFLNGMYLVVGLATCLSLGLFGAVVLRRFSAGAAAMSLASLASWPAFLVQLNQYCTESFVLVGGLIALAGFWSLLEEFPRPRKRVIALLGVACGLCLAVKLTFLPVVGALVLAASLSVVRGSARAGVKVARLALLGASTILAFGAATLPVFHRLDEVLFRTLERGDARIVGAPVAALFESGAALVRDSPQFVLLPVWFVLAAVVLAARKRRTSAGFGSAPSDGSSVFDASAGLLFIVLSASAFLYALACAAADLRFYDSVGHALRNASPGALVVPFAILFCARLRGDGTGQKRVARPWVARTWVVAATLVALASVSLHLVRRQALIASRLSEIAVTRARLGELGRLHGPVSFWDGSPGWRMGEVSFHLWGNYRYAESVFEMELATRFEGLSWFPLREIRRRVQREEGDLRSVATLGGSSAGGSSQKLRPAWRRPLHWLYQRWLEAKLRHPSFPRSSENWVLREMRSGRVGLLAFPELEGEAEIYRPLGWKPSDLQAWLERRLGPLRLWEERIGSTDWVFFAPRGVSDSGTSRSEVVAHRESER